MFRINKKIDLIFFSWTGNTKKVAEIIFNELLRLGFEINFVEIKPERDYPYLIWLFLSFIPNLGVKINQIRVDSDIFILCMPKWTFNCPPITSFLKQADLCNKTVYLVITYGGFDEKRYAKSYVDKIKKLGGIVKDVLLVKRSRIENDRERIVEWVKSIFK
ncbi:hypothetical protein DRO97_03680 [Archaeoglobales archaeon]|mgnify:CR=1 FL=1|nr:MAG: hypothetical protein DRO97_03680 [Archaeoglobales archaeon]